MSDIIKLCKSIRYLSKDKVKTQIKKKKVGCHMCDVIFTCEQNLEEHKELYRGLNAFFKGYICPKIVLTKKAMKNHVRRFHNITLFECKECGNKSKLQQAHNQHIEILTMVPDYFIQSRKASEHLQHVFIG